MRKLTISVGASKRSTNWTPKEITWEQLCKKLQTPVITNETVSEYAEMTKEQRGEIKDVGGYVGGRIEGGNRKAGSITDRQLVCLDADYGDMRLWDTWDLMVGKACLMHTSHSHTPENPRLRFVIPLARAITAAEYEPIARRIAEWLDINAFDDTTYEASRLMFWSSCSKDAEYICRVYESDEWVDPDAILATYEDWHDMRSWPVSNRQTEIIVKSGRLQGDPLTKPGVIGAFNRAYTVTEAIENFLPDVYVPAGNGRWTYARGSSTAGAVIYDDNKFIYSNHDTDPISRRLCSAFDMVRLHLYGAQDEGVDASIGELPSMSSMKALCQNDAKVQRELINAITRDPEDVFDQKTDLKSFEGDLTEQGLAVAMMDVYGKFLRYNKSLGWLFWDGIRWVTDAEAEASMLIMRYADERMTAAKMRMQLAADNASKKAAKEEYSAAVRLRSAAGVSHMLSFLKVVANDRDANSYDANPWALNTPDGIVDLRTGEIHDNNPREKCTKCTTVSPGGKGATMWLEFIRHITGGDEAFAEYLQTMAGMASVGAVYEEGLVISYGPGSNGKSTFFGALQAVLGDYAKTSDADAIINANGRNVDKSYIVGLRGLRLAIMSETEENAVMSVATMKRITSQDVITARALYKDPIEFKPTHTTVIHTNHLPRLSSTDGGTRRRITVAPFLATLPEERKISDFKNVLIGECGPAILKWIIEGAIRFYNNERKLPKPACVVQTTENYLRNEDWLTRFMDDCCELDEHANTPAQELYDAYRVWAGEQGINMTKKQSDFCRSLMEAGFENTRFKGRQYWAGIKIAERGE